MSRQTDVNAMPETVVPSSPAWDGHTARRCVAWRAFQPGSETLRARIGEDAADLCAAPAVGDPAVIAADAETFRIAAPVCDNGAWSCRRFLLRDSRREALPDVLPRSRHLQDACLAAGANHTSFLALTVARETRHEVRVYAWGPEQVDQIMASSPNLDSQRPAVCVAEHVPFAAYDAWDGDAYHVYVRSYEKVWRLSRLPGWHTCPDATADQDGNVWITWVRTSDVTNPPGVVDSRCEIMLSCLRRTAEGKFAPKHLGAVDDLSHGLLDVWPNPKGTWGYLGRRRRPFLVRVGRGMILIWEQKEKHDGPTGRATGVLWSRLISAEDVGPARPLARAAMGYEPPGSRVCAREPWEICAMEGWTPHDRRIVFRETCASDAQRLRRDAWRGWRDVRLPLPETRVTKRPSMTVGDQTYHLYWLDPHGHTELSADAEGETDVLHRYARHKAQLDGVVMTDNDHYLLPMTNTEWRHTCHAAELFNTPGRFVALPGYEWTRGTTREEDYTPNHRSVILPHPADKIVRWSEVDGDLKALHAFVRKAVGLVHAHHQEWELAGDPLEVNIEAASSWQAYLDVDPSCYHRHLLEGRRIGLIAGSDEHRRNPGLGGALTGVWAEELTRDSIMDALRSHRCYATTGRRVIVDFRANGLPMGSVLREREVTLELDIAAPVPITAVELIDTGRVIHRWDAASAKEVRERCEVTVRDERRFFYVKVLLEGPVFDRTDMPSNLQPALGARAWSSPVWIEPSR